MQPNRASDGLPTVARSRLRTPIPRGPFKQLGLVLAWIVLWGVTLAVSSELAERYYLRTTEQEGFAAMLGMTGVFVLAPSGFVVSILMARKTGRLWPFLAGAPVTGAGTVAFFLIAFAPH